MQIETPIGESASLLPPHVCSTDGTGGTILPLRIKIELYIFHPSPLGNGGACFCFEQPPRLANEGLRDAGPLISIVSLTHFCCSQKATPGCCRPSPAAPRLAELCSLPAGHGPLPARIHAAPGSGQRAPRREVPGRQPQNSHQSEVSHKGQK